MKKMKLVVVGNGMAGIRARPNIAADAIFTCSLSGSDSPTSETLRRICEPQLLSITPDFSTERTVRFSACPTHSRLRSPGWRRMDGEAFTTPS